jgi:hypothetical protein
MAWLVGVSGPVKVRLELDVLRPAVERNCLRIGWGKRQCVFTLGGDDAQRQQFRAIVVHFSHAGALSALQRGDKNAKAPLAKRQAAGAQSAVNGNAYVGSPHLVDYEEDGL